MEDFMSNIIQRFMDELPQSQLLGVAIAIIVIGLLICFFGYKLMRVGITVIGFSIGFFITAFMVNYFTNNNWITFPAAIIVGLLIAFAAFRLYEMGKIGRASCRERVKWLMEGSGGRGQGRGS